MNKRILVVTVLLSAVLLVSCMSQEAGAMSVSSPTVTSGPTQTPPPTPTETMLPTYTPLPTDTPTPIPPTITPTVVPTQMAPFDLSQGSQAWKDLVRIEGVFNEANVELRFTFEECSEDIPDEYELIVSNSNGCWKVSNIEAFGMRDENPETEEMDYISTMVFLSGGYSQLNTGLRTCRSLFGPIEMDFLCVGSYGQVEIQYGANTCDQDESRSCGSTKFETIPESNLGFSQSEVDNFWNSWPLEPEFSGTFSTKEIVGVIGLDKRTATTFFREWLTFTGYFDGFFGEE